MYRIPVLFASLCAVVLVGCAEDAAKGESSDSGTTTDQDAGDGGSDDVADTSEQDLVGNEPVCLDLDGDGAPGSGMLCRSEAVDFDCDDTDAEVHPGAVERCNGVDDNCNDQVDERIANLCGGCEPISPVPGQVCGDCNRVVCDGTDASRCDTTLQGSDCGGCDALSDVPGTPWRRVRALRLLGSQQRRVH